MWIKEVIKKASVDILIEFFNGVIDGLSELVNNIFILASKTVEGSVVSTVSNYSLKLAISILVFLAISQVIRLYVLNESGEPEEDFLGFFIRLGKTIILVSFSTIICKIIIDLSTYIANDLRNAVGGTISMSSVLEKDLVSIASMGFGEALLILLIILIILIFLIIVCIQSGIRGVNLAVLQMTAPLFAVNYITTDKGLWKKWLQNLISVAVTYGVQITLMNIALKYLAYGITSNLINGLIGICWLIVCMQSPKFLKELAYSTGVGSGLSRGVSSASQVVMSFSRFIK